MPRAAALTAAPAAAALGAFAAGVEPARLPAVVLDAAHAVLACDLVCALSAGDDAEPARALARGRRPAEATLVGDGGRAPAESAAFANAVAIHARAQDDTHYASQAHAGAAVIPAALALAEATGASGGTLVAALVAGYEVTAAIGEPLAAEVVARGFRASGVFGAPGAAAAAARALGLDAERTAHAIALAASFAGGLGQTWLDGTPDYLYHLGAAARSGVTAALLAAGGATGATRALEGEAGLARAFTGGELPAAATLDLGERFRITEAVFKPYPVCNITQAPVALAARAAAEGVEPARATSIRLFLNPDDRVYPGTLGTPPFAARATALMSAAFCVAAGLVHGTVTLAVLDAADDPRLAALAARTVVEADPALPPLAARLEIDAGDRRFAAALVPDDRTYRWSFDEVAGFCRGLAAELPAGTAVEDLLAACAGAEDLPDLGPLLAACVHEGEERIAMPSPDEALTYDAVLQRDGVQVSRSPWGPDDQIGRLNWITAESTAAILGHLDGGHVFDLSVDYFKGMPSWTAAGDPPYDIWMTHTPQGSVIDDLSGVGGDKHRKYSYSGDAIQMYTHCGTHLDTLNHFGHFGCFWNGWTPDEDLGSRHWTKGGAEHYPPIIARGVLVDIAGLHGVDCLPELYEITPDDLQKALREQKAEIRRGDVVCVRTGRMTVWPDAEGYMRNQPGIGLTAAKWLCEEAGAMCIASDSLSLEVVPAPDPEAFLPVHAYMFSTAGAQIMEVVQMEEIAAERQYEFAFIGSCLRLTGATGSPLRPLAVPLRP